MKLGITIREKRKELGISLTKLSKLIGCSAPYLSTIETGKVGPPARDILLQIEKLLGFETGKLLELAYIEKMPPELKGSIAAYKLENARLRNILKTYITTDNEPEMFSNEDLAANTGSFVPVINKVAAGYPTEFDDLGYPVGIADDYIRCPDLSDPNAFAVRIVGNSMEPDYIEGDIVVFSPSRAVNNGEDCFIRLAEPHETTFKRVYFQTDGTVLLQPRNKDYTPFVAAKNRINGIYKAVRKYQSV